MGIDRLAAMEARAHGRQKICRPTAARGGREPPLKKAVQTGRGRDPGRAGTACSIDRPAGAAAVLRCTNPRSPSGAGGSCWGHYGGRDRSVHEPRGRVNPAITDHGPRDWASLIRSAGRLPSSRRKCWTRHRRHRRPCRRTPTGTTHRRGRERGPPHRHPRCTERRLGDTGMNRSVIVTRAAGRQTWLAAAVDACLLVATGCGRGGTCSTVAFVMVPPRWVRLTGRCGSCARVTWSTPCMAGLTTSAS